jgi:hypothetical protein
MGRAATAYTTAAARGGRCPKHRQIFAGADFGVKGMEASYAAA